MKNKIKLFLTLLFMAEAIVAQNITFDLIDPQPQLQGSDTGDMEFADIDNDGDVDLIITGSGNMTSGELHGALTTVYINDGTGDLSPVGNRGIQNVRSSKIGFADIDNDTDVDLLISGFSPGGTPLTKLYRNDGMGNFTEEQNTPFQNLTFGYFNFGDLDNDGDQDLLFSGGNTATNNIFKYVNNGSGVFTEVISIGVDGVNGVLDLFDFDNDNDLDVLVAGEDASGNILTRLFDNDGNGIFTMVSSAGFNNFTFGDIATGDMDDDGDLDVLMMGTKTNSDIETEFYINNGNGTFTWQTDAPFADVGFGGETSFNDFDNDGDLDVFLIGSGEGGISTNSIITHIYENQGNNNFVLSDELIGGYLSTHAVADINNDGFPDLVLGGSTTGSPVRGSFIYTNTTDTELNLNESSAKRIALYPNPSLNLVNLQSAHGQIKKIELYTMTGSLIFKTKHHSNNLQLNIDSYPSGAYLLKVFDQKNNYTNLKLIKK